jgi:hypothetical protein
VLLTIEAYRGLLDARRDIADLLAMPGVEDVPFDPPRALDPPRSADLS